MEQTEPRYPTILTEEKEQSEEQSGHEKEEFEAGNILFQLKQLSYGVEKFQ